MSERKVVQVELRARATFDVEVSVGAGGDEEWDEGGVEIHSISLAQRGFIQAPVQEPETSDLSEEEFATIDAAAFEAFGVSDK